MALNVLVRLRRVVRRQLRSWLLELLRDDEDIAVRLTGSAPSHDDGPPELLQIDDGPPAHWVERVRHAAPELLRPSRADLAAGRASLLAVRTSSVAHAAPPSQKFPLVPPREVAPSPARPPTANARLASATSPAGEIGAQAGTDGAGRLGHAVEHRSGTPRDGTVLPTYRRRAAAASAEQTQDRDPAAPDTKRRSADVSRNHLLSNVAQQDGPRPDVVAPPTKTEPLKVQALGFATLPQPHYENISQDICSPDIRLDVGNTSNKIAQASEQLEGNSARMQTATGAERVTARSPVHRVELRPTWAGDLDRHASDAAEPHAAALLESTASLSDPEFLSQTSSQMRAAAAPPTPPLYDAPQDYRLASPDGRWPSVEAEKTLEVMASSLQKRGGPTNQDAVTAIDAKSERFPDSANLVRERPRFGAIAEPRWSSPSRGADRWPALPEPPAASEGDAAVRFAELDHRRSLDLEQRGKGRWNA